MAPKFALVRGSFTRYFVIVYDYPEDPVKKNGAEVTKELWIVVWRPYFQTTGLQRAPDCFHLQYYSGKLTTPRRKIKKIRHEIEIVKVKEPTDEMSSF
jgi:hypothetical protein